jgi:hypothetical protein
MTFVSCKKTNDTNQQVLTASKHGIFGKILLYDEYGNVVSDYSGITIKGDYKDTTRIDPITKTMFDSSFTIVADAKGNIIDTNCISGVYSFTFIKDQFGTNKVVGFSHSTTSGDTLTSIILAKIPLATITIDTVTITPDYKLLNITRKVTLTGNASINYGVVSRYFFSNSVNVSNKDYLYQWVSGATIGNGGTVSSVVVQKSTDKFVSAGIDLSKPVYMKAYIDNIQYYGYLDSVNAKTMVFPNVTSPSRVVKLPPIILQ